MSKKNTKPAQPETAAVDEVEVVETATDTQVEAKVEEPAQPETAAVLPIPLVTVDIISSSATNPGIDTRLVKVLIKYPEDYKGRKFFKDGKECDMSPESAEVLIKKGIAEKV